MKRIVLILSVFIGIMACQQEDGSKISDKYQELFKLSKETEDEITSSDECKSLKKSLSGFAQYKEYYAAHGKAYQKGYSSTVDKEADRMACVEYLMGQTAFLSGLHSIVFLIARHRSQIETFDKIQLYIWVVKR